MSGLVDSLSIALPLLSTGWVLARLARRRVPTCVGYNATSIGGAFLSYTDCPALRSRLCNDGRCSFHCREQCACEEP